MARYVLRRIVSTIPVLFFVSVVVFGLRLLTPEGPASMMLGPHATPEEVSRLAEEMGLHEPVTVQYVTWLRTLLQGDLGESFTMKMPVSEAIMTHLTPTVQLAILAQIVTITIAIPAGVLAARHQGKKTDAIVMTGSLLGISIPSFIIAIFAMLIFGVTLGWLPVAGYVPIEEGVGPFLERMIMPAVSLGAIQAAVVARMTRSAMLDSLRENYIKTAVAKGLSGRVIAYKHALRNAALPVLTVLGETFGVLVTGAVVTETVFNIPGLGRLVLSTVTNRDFPVIQGVVLTIALLYIVVNLIVDMLYAYLDPRIRIGVRAGG